MIGTILLIAALVVFLLATSPRPPVSNINLTPLGLAILTVWLLLGDRF